MPGRFFVCVLAVLTILTGLGSLIVTSTPAAAMSPTNAWAGYPASAPATYNQTLSTHMFDDSLGAEMGLSVNIRDETRPSGWHHLSLVTSFVANVRHTLEYTPWPDLRNDPDWSTVIGWLGNSMSLGDDQGAFVTLSQDDWLWYYGVWYNSIWVSENGFLVFDARATNSVAKFNNPTPPSAIPIASSNYPTSFAAPYWKNLHGGTIKYGYDPDIWPGHIRAFTIAWVGVLDANNNPQNFYARIFLPPQGIAVGVADVEFYYGSISTTSGIKVGMENQLGTLGYDLDPYYYLVQHHSVTIQAAQHDFNTIADLRISASKWVSNPSTNDISAWIAPPSGGDLAYPGGVNVVLMDYAEQRYLLSSKGTAFLDAGKVALETVAEKFFVRLGKYIPVLDLVFALSEGCDITVSPRPDPMCKDAVRNDAPVGVQTAYTQNRGMAEELPPGVWKYFPWDVAYFPVFEWVYNTDSTAGAHHLDINVDVDVCNQLSGVCTMIHFPLPISLSMNNVIPCSNEGSGVGWSGRTSPDGRPYSFSVSCDTATNYLRYGMTESRQADDPVYTMYGWTKLSGSPPDDFTTDSYGTLQVQGSFTFNDALSGSNLAYSGANLFVINPVNTHADGQQFDDKLDNIIKTIPVFTSSDSGQRGTWVTKSICVSLGTTWATKQVKIAYGRPVSLPGFSMSVGWTRVSVSTPGCSGINGSVRNSGNSPIPGAGVQATAPSGTTSSAITDANGLYYFSATELGTYSLTASKCGYVPSTQTVSVSAWGVVYPVPFTLSTYSGTGNIAPIKVTAGGSPVQGAFVSLQNCGSTVYTGTTDSAGQVPGRTGLAGGIYSLSATWTDWSACTGDPGQYKWTWIGTLSLQIPPSQSPTIALSRDHMSPCPI